MSYRPGYGAPVEPPSIERCIELLHGPIMGAPLDDLANLQAYLPRLDETNKYHSEYQQLVEATYDRAQQLAESLMPRLKEVSLPLNRELRQIARELSASYKALATAFGWVLVRLNRPSAQNVFDEPRRIMGLTMKCLQEQQVIALLTAAPQPSGLWHAAYQLYEQLPPPNSEETPLGARAEDTFREMLALACCQPESLSSSEVALALEYVRMFSQAIGVSELPVPSGEDMTTHWADINLDHSPTALSRRMPNLNGRLMNFSCARLAAVADGHVRELENGISAQELRLPAHFGFPASITLLKRLHKFWLDSPKRVHPRRKSSNMLQLCAGLENFWRILEQGSEGMPVLDLGSTSDWIVTNDSPAGYAVMHSSGDISRLENGSMVAVRCRPDQLWEICVVRWMSSENPEHIEMGLQLVSIGAKPIQIAFRNVKDMRLVPALLLSPMAALRSHRAILAPAGSCRSNRFVIVAGHRRIYSAQGTLLTLTLQTSHVELFEYEHDPSPD